MTKGNISVRVWTQAAIEPSEPFALSEGELALDRELMGVLDNSVSRAPNSPRLTRRGRVLTLWCNPKAARQPLVVQGVSFRALQEGLGGDRKTWKVLPARISNVGRMASSEHTGVALLSSLPKGGSDFSHYLFSLPPVEEPGPDAHVSIRPPAIIVLGDAALEVVSDDLDATKPAGRWQAWRLQLDDCLARIEDPASLTRFAEGRACGNVLLPGADAPEPYEEARLSAARVLRRSAQPWLFVPALTSDDQPRLALLFKTSFDADPYARQGLIVSATVPQSLPDELVQHLGDRTTATIGLPTEAPPSSRFSVTERPVLMSFGRVSTSSAEYAEELRQLARLSSSSASVLFLGEPGVGKRTLSFELHRQSARVSKPLISLTCADVTADELNAALLQARAGTLLFDEIGKAPLDMQRLMLREIESGDTDVRLLSTSSGDLSAQIRDGSFDPNLYARIADVTLDVPPLRDRREDVPRLARELVEELAPGRTLGASALQAFMRYSFPENLSELKRVLERGLSLHDGERLDHAAFSLGGTQTYRPPSSVVPGGGSRHG